MKTIKIFESETDIQLKEYQNETVPNVGDEIKINSDFILYVEHRIFDAETNIVELYGSSDYLTA